MAENYLLLSKIVLGFGIILLIGAFALMYLSGTMKRIYFLAVRQRNVQKEKRKRTAEEKQKKEKEAKEAEKPAPKPLKPLTPEDLAIKKETFSDSLLDNFGNGSSFIGVDMDDEDFADLFNGDVDVEYQGNDSAMTMKLSRGTTEETDRTELRQVKEKPKFMIVKEYILVKEGEECRRM